MIDELLEILVCPVCMAELEANFTDSSQDEGDLTCTECFRCYPVEGGIPQMLVTPDPERSTIAQGFGVQWKRYSQFKADGERQFLDWLNPVEPDFFRGKRVLDGGCGRGHHALNSASFGARMVVGVDLGRGSTEVARASTLNCPNAQIVRADLMALPFRPGTFDYAYSIGVLHHLPSPIDAFKSVLGKVRPGGHISAWVYGLENNEWIIRFIDPLRTHICSRIPPLLLGYISRMLAALIILVTRGIYRPLLSLKPDLPLFYKDYLMYIADFPLRDIETITYDHLQPTVAYYLSRGEFSDWFEALEDVSIGWHNSNSWRGFAKVPE
jgi:SAM-dependent methyltransferase